MVTNSQSNCDDAIVAVDIVAGLGGMGRRGLLVALLPQILSKPLD